MSKPILHPKPFRLMWRIVHFRGGYRWIVTDRSDAVFAHGQSTQRRAARSDLAKKLHELEHP